MAKTKKNVAADDVEETAKKKTKKAGKLAIKISDDDEDSDEAGVLKSLEQTIKEFEKKNSDTKVIDQDEFMDAIQKYDLSEDDSEQILEQFKKDGYEISSPDEEAEEDFDESKMKEMQEDEEDDDVDIEDA